MSCLRVWGLSVVFLGLFVLAVSPAWAAAPKKSEPHGPAKADAAPAVVVPGAKELARQIKRQHPRLLVDEAGFEELRRKIKTDPKLLAWDKQLQRNAEKLLDAPLSQHVIPDGKRLLATSRRVVERSYTLALAYRLHGDRRFADRLWRELEAVAAFPDFNPGHFLDTAEMTHGLAIAYDWLYDTWTEAQRATIRRAMIRHGLQPGLDVYRNRTSWWPHCTHNWNQVCNGGLTMGALAIGDEEPALAGEILRHALAGLPRAMHSYAPDGAWGEGPGYWNYATTYNVVMLAALDSAMGTDFGLSKLIGFDQCGLFPIYMLGPTGRTFNFADSSDRLGRADCLFWLARRFDRPVLGWFAETLEKPAAAAMIWYSAPGQDPVAAGLPLDRYWRGVEVATMRGRWNDPQAVFVGMQAGSNRVNHNHLDLGSFVLDALGQRWAVDLGGDDYNLPGYFGNKRYSYYRLRAEGHNTLVLDPGEGPDQDVKADARIRRFESKPERTFAIADLTPAYAKRARRVERGVALLDRRSVLVEDEIEAQKPATVWWFMHTPAAIALGDDGRTATLSQGGAKLSARLLSPEGARLEVREALPLDSSPNPAGQRRNEGVRKLAIHLSQVKNTRVAVVFAPVDGQTDSAATMKVQPLAEW